MGINTMNFENEHSKFTKRHMRCKVRFCLLSLSSDRIKMKEKQKPDVEEQQQQRSLVWFIHILLNVVIIQLLNLNQLEILNNFIKELNGILLRLRKVILNLEFMLKVLPNLLLKYMKMLENNYWSLYQICLNEILYQEFLIPSIKT